MSASSIPNVLSEVINARRTESLDAPSILNLVEPSTTLLFGRVNIVNLIERAVLAVTLSNENDAILGHATFLDYPNVLDIDPARWERWLREEYEGTELCTPLNTLFMHYFVAKPDYSHGCAEEIIRTLFNAVPELQYCFLVVPIGIYPDPALAAIFTSVGNLADGPTTSLEAGALFVCHRYNHVPMLHIREARVEDSSDLMPIFLRQNATLVDAYSTYFLAEIVEAQDENLKCLVAEVDGLAVGFMSVTRKVNVELLNECFELAPFHGLKTPHPDDDQVLPVDDEETESLKAAPAEPDVSRSASVVSNTSIQPQDDIAGVTADTVVVLSPTGSHISQKVCAVESVSAVQQKLSDEPAGSHPGSLMSERGDTESMRSEGFGRALSTASESQSDIAKRMLPCTVMLPPSIDIPHRHVPEYHGECNAFSIQLFVIDEKYEMRSVDFLSHAFQLFPDLTYCAITVPHMVPEFPLLQQFVRANPHHIEVPSSLWLSAERPRVTPRSPSILSQQLYVFCKDGLRVDFRVRLAQERDTASVLKLVSCLQLKGNTMRDFQQYNAARRDDDGTELQAFVAECDNQVVGVAIIRREENIEYIRSHYNIEDFIYYNHHQRDEHASLHHYALNPIFKHYSKHFIKEVLRLGHKTCLYYKLFPSYIDKEVVKHHSLVASLGDMVPVKARRQITYPLGALAGNAPSERVLRPDHAYALTHINRKLTLEPKVTINAQIIVIGASDASIAFLETLAFCPHLRFNNLTLISPHGLPGELPFQETHNQMTSKSECYSHEDYAQMSLRTWVNVVYGRMVAINRKFKHVIVSGGERVPYDHLVLATGLQYQGVTPSGADIGQLVTNNELPTPVSRSRDGDARTPSNVFVVNDEHDAAVALHWCERELFDSPDNVIVYGNSLDVFCCVQALLSLGIEGEKIILIQPPLEYETSCFPDPTVEAAAIAGVKESGVGLYEGYVLAQWNDGNELGPSDDVYVASFTSSSKPLRVTCRAIFTYYKKLVDLDAFKAINDACLVFDGRLVIDANFHTNDVAIRGVGPITKFQRSYHAEPWTHANYNSKEIGIQLANAMLPLFDPTLEAEEEPPQDTLKLTPMYQSPKVQSAFLPGKYYYLNMMKPSLNTPLETKRNHCDYGRELSTGHPGTRTDYFRLHINQYNTVESITCLSQNPFPASNIKCLYGIHERCLNNIVARFDEHLIADLYSYFNEPWCLAIYHDRFPDFREEIRELLLTSPTENEESLEEKMRRLFEEDMMLSEKQMSELGEEFQVGGYKRAVEMRLLSFLSYNYYHLPMYAKPGMV